MKVLVYLTPFKYQSKSAFKGIDPPVEGIGIDCAHFNADENFVHDVMDAAADMVPLDHLCSYLTLQFNKMSKRDLPR